MPRRARTGLAAWMALIAALAAVPADAQEIAPPVIIIVDVQQILRDSLVAKNVQAEMTRRTDRYTKEVSEQENALRQTQDELERQRTVLSVDAFNAKMHDFQVRYDALDHGVQATRQALQQAFNDAMTKVENAALQIISDIAAERKANLVVTKAAVLFTAPGLDVTQEVIRRLDEKMPDVPLAVVQEPALAPPSNGTGAVAPPSKN
jgi:outer membrane protein